MNEIFDFSVGRQELCEFLEKDRVDTKKLHVHKNARLDQWKKKKETLRG